MFKIGELNNIENENININLFSQKGYHANPQVSSCFDTLSFSIEGLLNNDRYIFYFELNCKPEKLLNLPDSKTVSIV